MTALLLLIRLHIKGFFRRFLRNSRSPKGIILTVVGALILIVWMGSAMVPVFFSRQTKPDVAMVQQTIPVVMLGLTVMLLLGSTGSKGITFTAAETDLLFPGPFSRRQLLLYRMLRTALASVFGAIFMGIGVRKFSVSWAGTYVVTLLLLMFIQVFTTAASLLYQSISTRLSGKKAQRIIFAAAIAIGVAGYITAPTPAAVTRPTDLGPLIETLTRLRDSTLIQTLALPFKPFAMAMTAPTWDGLLLWTLVSAAVVGLTLYLSLLLDADFLEASANQSMKLYELTSKAKKHGIAYSAKNASLRLPMPPRLGGVGPIAWRQSLTALRALRYVLLLFVILIIGGPWLIKGKGFDPTGPLASAAAFLTFLGGALFRFDFRADIDRLPELKALPITTRALVVGQLATPVLLLVSLQWLLCLMVAIVRPQVAHWALIAALFAPLVSLLFASIENFAFLLYPFRASPTPGDLVAIARNALLGLAKFAGLAITGGLAVGIGFGVKWLTDSREAGLLAGWLVGAALCCTVIPLVAWAYDRLDVTADASPNT